MLSLGDGVGDGFVFDQIEVFSQEIPELGDIQPVGRATFLARLTHREEQARELPARTQAAQDQIDEPGPLIEIDGAQKSVIEDQIHLGLTGCRSPGQGVAQLELPPPAGGGLC